MSKIRETEGIPWSNGTISNCIYTGVPVSSILRKAGVPSDSSLHVAFMNHSPVVDDNMFASSIPLAKAMDANTILAYEMSDEQLSRDHGFPLRVIVPGYAGARSVKWLDTITVQRSEVTNFYMQRDYKVLPSDVTSRDRDDIEEIWSSVPALQEMGVQSAICSPRNRETVVSQDGGIDVKGYAVTGEDGPIKAVRVSIDQGETWIEADLTYQQGNYSWTLWHCRLYGIIPSTKIWSRAESALGNLQPLTPSWNLRGVMSNGVDQITGISVQYSLGILR
jgi:sulfite oxidase